MHLEDFIRKNREELDDVDAVQEDQIWIGIAQGLQQTSQSTKQVFWLKVAAAVILLLTSSLVYTVFIAKKNNSDKGHLLATYFPELNHDFKLLDQQVRTRKVVLSFDTIDPKNYPDLFDQLSTLEHDYQSALQDLVTLGKQDAVLRILMRYHERQLALLERLANEIEKNKMYEQKNKQHAIY